MKISLKRLSLKNFRGYVDAVINFDSQMNVIIGRNDVGKSTILEALEIFFNNEQIKIDIDDKNVNCGETDKIEIACCFDIHNDSEIVIDSCVPINLKDEFLLNEEGFLEVHKVWDCSKKTINTKDLKVYIRANHPIIFENPLVTEKISELKSKLKNCVCQEIYNSTDKNKASEIRKAIYTSLINETTEFAVIDIDTTKEQAKDIWKSLQNSLPLFFLFKSDRLNSDKDSEVQTPMKAITKTVMSNVQNSIDDIINTVKKQVEDIGRETINKLAELNPEIAQTLIPKVTTKSFDSIFSFDLISDDNIPLNKRGSGVRRLILLSYFRTEAEKKIEEAHNNSIIYAIEEPETSQHPDYQKMIMETLQQISCSGNHQIILTTHTPEIAKMVDLKHLIFLYKDEKGVPTIELDNEKKYLSIATELGVLPFAVEQCVICVEGTNDVNFLQGINQIPEIASIINLSEAKIKIVPLQGSNLVRWVNANYFSESNIKEIHFYDNDREDYRKIACEIRAANDKRRFAFLTQRKEIENYIPPELIENEFGLDLSTYYTVWCTVDVPALLKQKVFLNINDEKKREIAIKNILCGKLSKRITADDLKKMGTYDEIETLFREIKAIVDGSYVNKSIYNE